MKKEETDGPQCDTEYSLWSCGRHCKSCDRPWTRYDHWDKVSPVVGRGILSKRLNFIIISANYDVYNIGNVVMVHIYYLF